MTVPSEHHVVHGRRLGKHDKRVDPRTLLLADFTAKKVPSHPVTFTLSSKVATWPMYLNDQEGDCAIAAPAHGRQGWLANIGSQARPLSNQEVEKAYEAVSGYKPGDPSTDTGCVLLDVLNYWRHTGIGADKITAFVDVPHGSGWIEAATYMFGGLLLGVQLPKAAEAQINAGQAWHKTTGPDAAPNSWGGHAIWLVDYSSQGGTCVTWGQLQHFTWGWLNAYIDEAWGVISPDWINAQGRSPEGLDMKALQAALSQFGKPQ